MQVLVPLIVFERAKEVEGVVASIGFLNRERIEFFSQEEGRVILIAEAHWEVGCGFYFVTRRNNRELEEWLRKLVIPAETPITPSGLIRKDKPLRKLFESGIKHAWSRQLPIPEKNKSQLVKAWR